MKKKVIYLIIILNLFIDINASEEQYIKTNLISVKVFQKGAELTHTAKAKLEKGEMNLIFEGIAQNINNNSINISAKGDLVILSVAQRVNYLKPTEKTLQVKMLEDSLELLNKNLLAKQNETEVLKAEMDLLFANKEIGGKEKNVSIVELQKMGEYFRKRLIEIKSQITEISFEIKNIQKNIERITKQLNELKSAIDNQPVKELMVTVNSNSNNNAEFKISYLINDASWQPSYDIRVDKINSPAILSYKANVKQNSGIDWKDINIILSTRNPIQNNNIPELIPWFVDFIRPILQKDVGVNRQKLFSPQVDLEVTTEAKSIADYFEVSQTQLAAEFIPSIKYSIPSDNKSHIIELQSLSIPANYKYYAVPKLDNNAFLVAYLSGWNNYNLLPGSANIYFENSYVGQSYINPFTSKDTLTISMGRDPSISITKQTIKDFTEDKFLSSDIERTFAYEIKIKNNKTTPIDVLIEDQIPISKNEEIKIRLIDADGGTYIKDEGKIKWNIQLNSSQSTTKKLIYSVRYPKDKKISNL